MVNDAACVSFLQWALPQLGMRWRGFRKVRRQVCRRIRARCRELELDDLDAYRGWLEAHPDEWARLDAMCIVTISRFWRDRVVFEDVVRLLPELASAVRARGDERLRCWSAGCASGEEPYSAVIAWRRSGVDVPLEVVGTDVDDAVLARARRARYAPATLRELSEDVQRTCFERDGDELVLRASLRERVTFLQQDLRRQAPAGRFDLVLCRHLAFTYFDDVTQGRVLARIARHTHGGGALVVGTHETLPGDGAPFKPWPGLRSRCIYRRR